MAEELEEPTEAAEDAPSAAPMASASDEPEGWDMAADADGLAGSERILNQDEIDSLLGFDLSDDDAAERTGIRAIINSALVSYERLPMLEIVFDRLVRLMTTSLRNFTSDNVEVSLDNISSIRFGDYLNSIPLPAILSVFRAEELDNLGLLTVDSNLIYSIVDVLLGGRRGTAAMRIEGRPYTTIERVLVERMVEVVLHDCHVAFEPLTPVTFTLDRLETNPRFAAIARPANAAILVKLRIDMEDRGGRIELLLPYATLEPIRKMLLQQFMGEKFGRDNIWESHLATELWTTQTEVRAILDEQQMPLSRVLDLKVGDTILLNATPDTLVELRAGPLPLTSGRMGRRNHHIAVRVEAPLTPSAKQAVQRIPMSDIALIMNGLLGVLLVGALFIGWRLEGRLKALRASHHSFAEAVEDLDRAAARAEQGLADLRAATDEAAESLAGRIERAKALSVKLERLTEDAAEAEARLAAMPRPAPALVREAPPSRDTSFSRLAERYGHTAPAQATPPAPTASAPARTDLILEETPERPSIAERLERLRAMSRPSAAAIISPARQAARARADDELFESPAPRMAAMGGRR